MVQKNKENRRRKGLAGIFRMTCPDGFVVERMLMKTKGSRTSMEKEGYEFEEVKWQKKKGKCGKPITECDSDCFKPEENS